MFTKIVKKSLVYYENVNSVIIRYWTKKLHRTAELCKTEIAFYLIYSSHFSYLTQPTLLLSVISFVRFFHFFFNFRMNHLNRPEDLLHVSKQVTKGLWQEGLDILKRRMNFQGIMLRPIFIVQHF